MSDARHDGVVNTSLTGLSTNSNGTRSLEMELKKDTSVSFTNEREAIIPTGAYVPGFLFAGILTILLGGYVGFLYYRRKRDDAG
ncbi:MAG: LPXTG cell wall anchor domain-containing protein [Lachnospiraceae bacterium]|nr:LPXTG cell wall anchor domain-containing protein [Lachnospiraceae bacterium]